MKEYKTETIKNVALTAHSGAGKTSLTEAILYHAGLIERLGNITDGNTASDYDPEEITRTISINSTIFPIEHKNHKINFIDSPGYRDFVGDTQNAVRVADSSLIVVDAVTGIDVGTDFAMEYANNYKIPKFFFINKLDKERSDFEKTLSGMKEAYDINVVPVTFPIGSHADFSGVVDLLKMKAIKFDPKGKPTYEEIPANLKAEADKRRSELVEAAAEGDDELTMKFLDDQPLTDEEITKGIKGAMVEGRFAPVFCGSALKIMGISNLLDFITIASPSPSDLVGWEGTAPGSDKVIVKKISSEAPFSAFVFKVVSDPFAGKLTFIKIISGEMTSDSTFYNISKDKSEKIAHLMTPIGKKQENIHRLSAGDIGVVAKLEVTKINDTLCDQANQIVYPSTLVPRSTVYMAISAAEKKDEEKISVGIRKLIEQDPTLSIGRDPEIKQTLLHGLGDTHLDVAVSRVKRDYKIEVIIETPKIPYKETITKSSEGQSKYKKQSGGKGQYGDVWLKFEPLPSGTGFQFVDAIVGGVIPGKFIPAVEKGLLDSLERGIVSGNQVVDLKATCYDGSYHNVDSSEMSFKVAASLGFKKITAQCSPVILEPIMKVTVIVLEENMGDIMGNFNSKRGKILGMSAEGKKQKIEALIPLAEMFEYSRELRSMTRGSGVYEMDFDHYEKVPHDVQAKIVEEYEKNKKEEEE